MARAGKRRYNFMGGSSSSSSLSEEASSFICGPLWSLSLSRSVGLSFGRSPLEGITAHNRSERERRTKRRLDSCRVPFVRFSSSSLEQFAREEKILTSIASMLKKEGRKKRWLIERPFFPPFLPSTLFSPLFTTCQKCQKSANTFKDCLEYTHREM